MPLLLGDGGHKCAHIIALDNGNFAAQPNNRVQWFCPAFILSLEGFITPFTSKPNYLTNTRIWKVERETETTQAYFYDPVGVAPPPPRPSPTPRERPSHRRSPTGEVKL